MLFYIKRSKLLSEMGPQKGLPPPRLGFEAA